MNYKYIKTYENFEIGHNLYFITTKDEKYFYSELSDSLNQFFSIDKLNLTMLAKFGDQHISNIEETFEYLKSDIESGSLDFYLDNDEMRSSNNPDNWTWISPNIIKITKFFVGAMISKDEDPNIG